MKIPLIYTLKKLNITSGVGLEYQKFYTKQLFPFSFFYVGNVINKIMEIISFQLNLGSKLTVYLDPQLLLIQKTQNQLLFLQKMRGKLSRTCIKNSQV